MTEAVKTVIFAGVALVLAIGAYVSRPQQDLMTAPSNEGQPLFPAFEDPAEAASLQIVRYDETVGELHEFEVAKDANTGLWSIPSHSNYPADAEDQMSSAALSLVGLKVLGVVTEDPSEHQLFGVLEPNEDELKLGEKGVGLLVRFRDEQGKDLAKLVVGREVKQSEGQRFVRIPGQDRVYAVEIDPETLSTSFEDWIEADLLQLNPMDVARVTLKDYSLVPTTGGGLLPEKRFDATVVFNSADSQWELEEFVTYRQKEDGRAEFEAVPAEIPEGQELAQSALNDLKSALGDLEIVDVRRKPTGLSANLTADEDFLNDQQTLNSLVERGFYPIRARSGGDGQPELLSANGEVHILMNDGYEYVLRFGNIAGTGDDEEGGLNRYLFVTTRVDESQFPEPELEELPSEVDTNGADTAPPEPPTGQQEQEQEQEAEAAEGEAQEPEAAQDEPSEDEPSEEEANEEEAAEDEAAEEDAAEEDAAEEDAAEGEADEEEAAEEQAVEQDAAEQQAAEEEAPQQESAQEQQAAEQDEADEAQEAQEAQEAEAQAAENEADADEQETTAPEEDSEGEASEDDEPTVDIEEQERKLAAERERITKENQRKLDEWKENKQRAAERVRELNARFADWYYVISEDVYKKIHLSRSELVQEEGADEEAAGAQPPQGLDMESLRGLQGGGGLPQGLGQPPAQGGEN